MMVVPTSRVGIYAWVSASDKDLNPATQLLPLREFVTTRGWTIAGEFVDHASATDPRPRTAWRNLLDQASRRRVDLVLVWRIDRAFRSVHEVANTLERFREWNVGLRSYSEPWLDTTSPFGEALYCITIAYAQLERGIVSQRVRAGRDRAGRQRKRLGRRRAMNAEWVQLRPQIENGEMSWRRVAQGLGVEPGTAHRISWSGGDQGPRDRSRAEAVGDPQRGRRAVLPALCQTGFPRPQEQRPQPLDDSPTLVADGWLLTRSTIGDCLPSRLVHLFGG